MSAEDFDGIRELAKKNHAERVAKTPSRVEYAESQFEANNIKYVLKNASNGHFHAWDRNGTLHQFWASTGKILGSQQRGIRSFIRLLMKG